jgi:hypothetical protein
MIAQNCFAINREFVPVGMKDMKDLLAAEVEWAVRPITNPIACPKEFKGRAG